MIILAKKPTDGDFIVQKSFVFSNAKYKHHVTTKEEQIQRVELKNVSTEKVFYLFYGVGATFETNMYIHKV